MLFVVYRVDCDVGRVTCVVITDQHRCSSRRMVIGLLPYTRDNDGVDDADDDADAVNRNDQLKSPITLSDALCCRSRLSTSFDPLYIRSHSRDQ